MYVVNRLASEYQNTIISATGANASQSGDSRDAAKTKTTAATIKNMRWFKVTETRGAVENGKVAYWQVTIQLGFTLE